MTSWSTQTVYLGPGFFGGTTQPNDIIHELLHVGFSGDHIKMANDLGLTRPDGTKFGQGIDLTDPVIYNFENILASLVIDGFLDNNCSPVTGPIH